MSVRFFWVFQKKMWLAPKIDPNGSLFVWKIMINHQQSHVHKSKHAVFINQLTYHKINWLNHHAWWNPKICWWNPMSCWWRPAIHKWLQITGHPVPSSTSTRRRRLRRVSPQGHGARWHLRGLAVNSMDISGTNLLNPLKILMGFVQKIWNLPGFMGVERKIMGISWDIFHTQSDIWVCLEIGPTPKISYFIWKMMTNHGKLWETTG